MSRLMLAIKTKMSDINWISTYLFDEIDAGISGNTAKTVAEKFADIAKDKQILAVSHLAQISAMADRNYLIPSPNGTEKTLTEILPLDEEGEALGACAPSRRERAQRCCKVPCRRTFAKLQELQKNRIRKASHFWEVFFRVKFLCIFRLSLTQR